MTDEKRDPHNQRPPGPVDESQADDTREGIIQDQGVPGELRQDMMENARIYGTGETPANVNDEPAFDDGIPGSISDFSVINKDHPQGTARLADPNDDAGGEVTGGTGGDGSFDGGPGQEGGKEGQ